MYKRFLFFLCSLLLFTEVLSETGTPIIKSAVKDYDGNVYDAVKIGNQIWMVQNFRSTHYNDGKPIAHLEKDSLWNNTESGAYCFYNNDSKNAIQFGALYNWHAVNTGKLAPEGWHVPTNEEWELLAKHIGADIKDYKLADNWQKVGKNLKSISGWEDEGNGADTYGFNGVSTGYRYREGKYYGIGRFTYWWSTSKKYAHMSYTRSLYYLFDLFYDTWENNGYGFSVRLVKDKE